MALGGIVLILLTCSRCNGQSYQILHNFADADGAHPGYGNLVVGGTNLYGTTCIGGGFGYGVIFRIDPQGSNYTMLKEFRGTDGADPQGTIVLAGTNFFGVTEYGGNYDKGVIYKIGMDGSGYAVLHHFDYTNGGLPCAGVVISDRALYGTTSGGGANGWGTLYRLNTDGTDFSVLHHFDLGSGEGAEPIAELILSGSTLYGTAAEGTFVFGSVFRINTNGTGFQPLHVFSGGDGKWPVSPLVLAGNTLYGTADWGGLYDMGTLFQVNTDGTGFTVVRHFTGANDGAGVEAGLLLNGTALYGTTYEGGDYPYGPPYYGHGVIFRIKSNGGGFEVLKTFAGGDGANPRRSPVLLGGALYGLTDYGGTANKGVIYALSLPIPYITTPPRSQTAEVGSDVRMVVKAEPRSSLWYQWYFNGAPLGSGYTSALSLPALQPAQSGVYHVIVTNFYGAATSPPAMLAVIPAIAKQQVMALLISGALGSSVNLFWANTPEAKTDWHYLEKVTLNTSNQYYLDSADQFPTSRYYSATQTGTGAVQPGLQMLIATKLSLNGTVGSQVQIDCINPIGPTDAWTLLANVVLTNPVQSYHDFDAYGKPPRLYRVRLTP